MANDDDTAWQGALGDAPERIGPYRVLGTLGEGGMGIVYLAEQRQPVRRRVALKVIKLGMDTRQVLARFDAERQALAMMNHDQIARVFDAGSTERGQPYFAMEHVPGLPITEHCDRYRLTLAERLRLFGEVCAGVQHAHQKGVIHRDLKPSNVLVTLAQGKATAKIIDFGLARATDHRLIEATLFTEHGVVLGTPEYMSPEQAETSSQDIDTRTDVYSLGVLLYELLVGALPFGRQELRRAGLLEIQRKIREDEPPKPSTRFTSLGDASESVAAQRRTTRATLARALRGDLDWIVMRAMEKDRNRRYDSAAALADDLGRHLANEPVAASPPSTLYRLRKFVRKYRGQVAAAVALFVVLLAGVFAFAIANAQARRSDRLAREKVRQFDLLACDVRRRDLDRAAAALGPPWPAQRRQFDAWLAEADRLAAAVPEVEAAVAELERGPAAGGVEVTAESQRFLHATLVGVLADVRQRAPMIESVRQRAAWAARVEELTVTRWLERWQSARSAVHDADGTTASRRYRDRPIDLPPQIGLVPIGPNPKTKLWEFYHLRSAFDPRADTDPAALPIPAHRADGSIDAGAASGIVFVLVPGGSFWMGSDPEPGARNSDPMHAANEAPVHEVTLDAFFLARHELTQVQWARLDDGETPTVAWAAGFRIEPLGYTITAAHPVAHVDWARSDALLRRFGLALPTEAQWEYACRAGTDTPWSCGREAQSLLGHANVRDRAAFALMPEWGEPAPFDDGWAPHAPVGSFAANAWGLFDLHGNVYEWCADRFASYDVPPRPGDGGREPPGSRSTGRVVRGGCFTYPPGAARSAARSQTQPALTSSYIGLRAARPVLR